VISALAAAHGQGIVHRDIKPENILIANGEGETRHPKLLDFGIVKFAQPRGGRVLTEVGMLMGSPEYMSPEQAQGLAEIDGQTDVWSLSVVLYELITGRRPFSGSHSGAVLISIFRDQPVPTTELAAGDDELWSIIQRGMEKAPAKRWDGMRELGGALAAWALARGIETDASGVSISRQWLGSKPSLPSYKPPSTLVRTVAGQTPAFEAADQAATPISSVRSVPRTGALQGPGAHAAASPRRRTALITVGAVFAVLATIAAVGWSRSPSIQASAAAAESPAATTVVAAPAAPEPLVVAATAPIVLADAVTPPAIASSAPASTRVSGAPLRPSTAKSSSPRGPRSSMPLPAQPNF
jgi:hypothetical protein